MRINKAGFVAVLGLSAALTFASCADDEADPVDDTTPPATEVVIATESPTATTTTAGTATPASSPADAEGEEAIRERLEELVGYYNAGDAESFGAGFTDQGIVEFAEEPGITAEQARAGLADFVGTDPVALREVRDIEVDDATATAEAEFEFGRMLGIDHIAFIQEDGEWLIVGYDTDAEAVEIPDGADTVDVNLVDFAFEFDPAAIPADGNVGFALSNEGEQAHEFVLVKLAEGVDLAQTLEQMDPNTPPPDTLEFYGGVTLEEPGDESTMVLTEALEPGRYGVVCFLPDVNDPEETPHALKGMTAEFTVGE